MSPQFSETSNKREARSRLKASGAHFFSIISLFLALPVLFIALSLLRLLVFYHLLLFSSSHLFLFMLLIFSPSTSFPSLVLLPSLLFLFFPFSLFHLILPPPSSFPPSLSVHLIFPFRLISRTSQLCVQGLKVIFITSKTKSHDFPNLRLLNRIYLTAQSS
jgi:hypothetical protein